MTALIDIITARHDEAGMTSVEVPEWGTTLYFRPLTPAERASIRKGIDPADEEELMIKLLVSKALDADGKRVFDDTAKTRAALMSSADMNVIVRIATQAGRQHLEDDAKNA